MLGEQPPARWSRALCLGFYGFSLSPKQIYLPGVWLGAIWGANGTAPGLSLLPSVPSATLPPPLPSPAWPGRAPAQHKKKGLKLLSLNHLELILLHHELRSHRSITAHLHIFH